MERLTEKGFNYSDAAIVENMRMATVSAVMNRLAAYEDTGLEPDEITDFLPTLKEWRQNMGALRHVHELVTAEAEGRLLVLPCKVGDTVYRIWAVEGRKAEITEHVMERVDDIVKWLDKFGKTVFLTCEAAETALKECEGT